MLQGFAATDYVGVRMMTICLFMLRYDRSGNEMIKMAEVYFGEDHLEAAYVLYMKYITLHIEKLPR